MRHPLIFTIALLGSSLAYAQPARPAHTYFEGFNLSMGVSQNSTDSTYGSTTLNAKTSVGVAKLNYTFGLMHPAKLGLTATLDLGSSKVSDTENLTVKGLTEVTVEPGLLLVTNSLLYGKLGSYGSRFESGSTTTRSLSGTSVGLGIKHYIYRNNFLQAEWTQRKASDNGAGLANAQFKQTATSLLLGFNF